MRLSSSRSGGIDLVAESGSRDRHRFRRSFDNNSIKDTIISSPRRETRTRTRGTPRHRHSKPKKCARASEDNNTPFRDPSSEPRKHVRETNGQRWYPPCSQAPAFHHPPYTSRILSIPSTSSHPGGRTKYDTLTAPLPGYGREGSGC